MSERTQIVNDIKLAASEVIGKDVTTLRGFAERQVTAIAQQAEIVAIGIKTNEITEETRDFFLDGLEDMSRNFANTLRGLVMVTIEKVWNAVVGAIWKAINRISGIDLVAP